MPAICTSEETMIDQKLFAKEVGARLAACRKEQGLTQTELGDLVGQSQQVIADYETGRRRIPACNLVMIAEAIGVSASELLEGTGTGPRKRGPASKLQQQFERVKHLPRSEQQFVIRMLDSALAGGSR